MMGRLGRLVCGTWLALTFVVGLTAPVQAFPWNLPPQEPAPLLDRMGGDATLYAAWYGRDEADPQSQNRTEQFIANPQFRAWVEGFVKECRSAIVREAPRGERELVEEIMNLAEKAASRPGGVYVKLAAGPAVTGGVALKLDANCKPAMELAAALLGQSPAGAPKAVQVDGQEWQSVALPPPAPAILWREADGWLLIAAGQADAAELQKQAAAEGAPADSPIAALRQKLGVARPAYLCRLNVAEATAAILPLLQQEEETAPQVLASLGLNEITTVAHVGGLSEDEFVSRTHVGLSGEPRGLIAFLNAKPIAAEELSAVPAEALAVLAMRLDLATLFDNAGVIAEATRPGSQQQIDAALAELKQETNYDFKTDLLGAVGDRWIAYLAPGSVGAWHGGLVLSVNVRDRAKLDARLATIRAAITRKPSYGNPSRIVTEKIGDQTLEYIALGERDAFIAPAWCLTENELVFALYPQTVRAHLTQAADATRKRWADRAEVQSALKGGASSLWFCDSQRMVNDYYPAALIAARGMEIELLREGFNLNAIGLPSARSLAENLRVAIATTSRREDGVWIESHETVPNISGPALVGFPIGLTAGLSSHGYSYPDFTPTPVLVEFIGGFSPSRAQQAESMNNLRQFILAMHNYHDVHNGFPTPAKSADGKPLLSWRVMILPYIEQQNLYNQFHLDEPWDSEHNKTLIAQMPQMYKSPGSKAGEGKSTYVLPILKDGVFQPDATRGARIRDIIDGTSNTIMILEVDDERAVTWTKPDDLQVDLEKPWTGLRLRQNKAIAGFADGHVSVLARSVMDKVLSAYLTAKGGEAIQPE